MSNNTNQQAINFCNNELRPAMDAIVGAYLTAQRLAQIWSDQGVYNVIPSDSNFIQDGATVASGTPDGRAPITDSQVNQIMNDINAFITFAGTNSWLTQLDAASVNAKSVI